MSWEDRVTKQLTITTGDSKVYTVIWLNASKSVEWHGSEFSFLEIPGTLAKKKKLLGRKYPLEFYFQGENHLEDYANFEKSLDATTKPCSIEHPLYNTIIAQIFSLNVDNTTMNYSKVTATAIETISEDNPVVTLEPVDQIAQKKVTLDAMTEAELTQTPSITDVNNLSTSASQSYKHGVKIITIPSESQDYMNAFSVASNAISTATASPLLAMRATISLLTLPAKFTADVKSRINTLVDTFNTLRSTIQNLLTVPAKQIYEVQGNSIISAMCLAASTPLSGNYANSVAALNIVDIISTNYKQFLADLDTLQSPNASSPLYFVPGFEAINLLNEMVNLTISSLIQIALSGKQERSLILTEDTNIIMLTHKLYSLDQNDNNINELIDNNSLTYRDMLGLEKGRKITYYV